MNILTNVSQLNSSWLTNILKSIDNPITHFEITHSSTTNVSTVYHLRVNYEITDTSLPEHLFLKLVNVAHREFFGKELTFYREIAPHVRATHPEFNALRCYGAEYDAHIGHAFLLFEDISNTHFGIDESRLTLEHYRQVIEGFAMLHATWWQHPRLSVDLGEEYTENWLNTTIRRAQTNYARLLSENHDHLDESWRSALSQVIVKWPSRRWENMLSGENMTIVHRDPHRHNFLYPRDNSLDLRSIIIDWDAWRVDHGTVDLAYMMGFHWMMEQRVEQEMGLLQHYHRCLEQYGIEGYSWEECLQDYRISIVRCLVFMLGAWRPGRNHEDVWWKIVDQGVVTYHDLRCNEIII